MRIASTSIAFLLTCTTLTMTSCIGGGNHHSNQEVGSILHEIQVELSELKYQMNTHQSELAFIEEKVADSDKTVSVMRKQTQSDTSIAKVLRSEIDTLRKQLVSLEKQSEKAASDLKNLGLHANQTTAALAQYKNRISSVEKGVTDQNSRLDEVKKLRGAITSLSSSIGKEASSTYQVVSGDTLDKIAQKNGTNVESIKRLNHLKTDRIIVGQELNIPN